MNDGDITAVLDKLVGNLEGEVGDWNDVLERSLRPVRALEAETPSRPGQPRRRRRRAALLAGVAFAAAIGALTVASPWQRGPSILERAAAAIEPPGGDGILSESIAVHTAGSSEPGRVIHVWVAGRSPRRFRITVSGARRVDVEGTVGAATGLGYDFVNAALVPVTFQFPVKESDLDPTAFIRSALDSGHARLDGTTILRGRKVLRIRLASQLWGRQVAVTTYYVDAGTYRPVRIAISAVTPNATPFGFPLTSLNLLPYGTPSSPPGGHVSVVYDFSGFGYLPSTPANDRLANIRAAYPHAPIL